MSFLELDIFYEMVQVNMFTINLIFLKFKKVIEPMAF